jgi:hypothetical protein
LRVREENLSGRSLTSPLLLYKWMIGVLGMRKKRIWWVTGLSKSSLKTLSIKGFFFLPFGYMDFYSPY